MVIFEPESQKSSEVFPQELWSVFLRPTLISFLEKLEGWSEWLYNWDLNYSVTYGPLQVSLFSKELHYIRAVEILRYLIGQVSNKIWVKESVTPKQWTLLFDWRA